MKNFITSILFISTIIFGVQGLSQTVTFNYTGALQTYTVPAGVTSITVDAQGGKGGGVNCAHGGYQSVGGCGGRVQATVNVTPGHILNITVGEKGSNTNGTAYGGGGKDGKYTNLWPGAGGGGGTTVYDATSGVTLVVAGGGGGGGGDECSSYGIGDGGGAGGGLIGATGKSNICGAAFGGKGGTQVGGGAGGVCDGYTGQTGTLGTGANTTASSSVGSGAGGGGYYGGGSGAYGGGGGGGSSYSNGTYVTGVIHTQGYNCGGNGTVIITTSACASGSISGNTSLCVGTSSTLNCTPAGGTWTSSNANVTISSTGVITGITLGSATVTYAISGTCYSTAEVIVNTNPTTISGTLTLCVGDTTTLYSTPVGGTWASSNGNASIDSETAIVTGDLAGTSIITYTAPTTCTVTGIVTVNANPITAITGDTSVCLGLTTTLNTTPAGGTWSSSTANATIGSTTGIVTGVSLGTAAITYMLNPTCYLVDSVDVDPNPTAISGNNYVCVGSTTTLNSTPAGGTWSSSNGNTNVNASTGAVTGVTSGTSTITYTLSTGCTVTTIVTVNPIPTLTGASTVCVGSVYTYTVVPSGGTWSTSGGISVDGSGDVTGVSAGTGAITYTSLSSCVTTGTVSVFAVPGPITGTPTVCSGASINLTDSASGGTWTTSSGLIATIGSSLALSPGSTAEITSTGPLGTVTITYSTGCIPNSTVTVTVAGTPASIAGVTSVCAGSSTSLSDAIPGGTWSSSAPLTGSVGSTSGIVTGINSGTTIISYVTACGSTSEVVSVNAVAVAGSISGPGSVCTGSTISLSDATASGGTGAWSSSNTAIGSVDPVSGIVYGASQGTVTITYTVTSASCGSNYITTVVTVNASPVAGAITSAGTVCQGATIQLSDATASGGTGTWSSSNPSVGSIGSASGIATGINTGTTTITFTETTLYCGLASATSVLTVNVSPVAGTINGPASVCTGSTISLSDVTASGGTGAWSSSNAAIGSVDPVSGIVYGASQGTVTITYTVTSASCGSNYVTTVVTVNASPAAGTISSAGTVCQGATIQLSDATASGGTGTWSSSNPSVGSIGSTSGIATGINTGTTTITFTETTLFCGSASTTTVLTVNVSPVSGSITGVTSVCSGSSVALSDVTASGGTGVWTSSNPTVGSVGATTGIVSGIVQGTTVITYTEISASCGSQFTTTVVTVNPSPVAGIISSTGFVCVGATIQLSDATASGGTGTWTSSNNSVGSVGATTGIVSGIAVGTTTIIYTETSTFCGSATASTVVTVNASPIAGTISGAGSVCTGATISLSDPTASGGTGVWTSSNPTAGTIGATTGIVYGATTGTTIITFTESTTSCGAAFATMTVTVNISPSAGTIGSAGYVCVGSTIQLSDATAGGGTGTWSSVNPSVGSVGSATGVVYGVSIGTTVISYTETSAFCGSAYTSTVVTVDVSPSAGAINGANSVCVGLTVPLTDATASGGTGAWSSSNGTIGTVGATTGIVYGVSGSVVTITYTETSGSCGSAFTTYNVTVNANPSPITGITNVCAGLTTTLNSSPAGGVWYSENNLVGTVGSASGVVYGASAGASTIVYKLSTGCLDSASVTVNPNPAPITGVGNVCVGQTTALTTITLGGTWSSGNPIAGTVGATTGVVYGLSQGTTTITYELSSGCLDSTTVVINPDPTTIGGTLSVCVGSTTTLNSTPAGGTWSSSSGLVSVNPANGVIAGVNAGNCIVTYTLSTGCSVTAIVTVNALPGAITGALAVCVGSATTLTDAGGGTWSLTNTDAGNSGGVVIGNFAGEDTVVYTLPTGCVATAVVTVNALPGSIAGSLQVCAGLSTSLSDATAGGTWVSGAPLTGSVGSVSGTVTGINSGTATITYKLTTTGCQVTAIVTVNPVPAPITGILSVCVGLTTSLSDVSPGGTWSSSNTNAAVGTGGIVTGNFAGISTITYAYITGCNATAVVTMNSLPGTISGGLIVCAGSTTSLSDVAGGTWASSSTAVATIGSISGIVTGGAVSVSSTATITYTLGTGCTTTAVVTVNPLPLAIMGTDSICAGSNVMLSDANGPGTWMSSATGIAAVGSTTGVVTGGGVVVASTATITYALTGTGCATTVVITVNPLPTAILGTKNVCSESQVTLSDASGAGTWTSSVPGIATIGSVSGIVTGQTVVAASTSTITFTLITGCITTTTITVNPLPAAINGSLTVCAGLTTQLSDASVGGTWSIAGGTGSASIGASSGLLSASSAGTVNVDYTLATGCLTTAVVTVNPLPNAILGTLSVCQGLQTDLSDVSAGGTWTSSNTAVATVSSTGVVTGSATGSSALTATITYTLPSGCINTVVVTVNPLPGSINGIMQVCSGLVTILTDATPGGTWSSSATGTASVGVTSGIVTGGSLSTPGTATITYKLTTTGCIETTVVTVDPLPTSILGSLKVCSGANTYLSDATPAGTWSSNATGIASIGSGTGVVTGGSVASTSEAIITYTIPTGCIATAIVTVMPLPAAISGVPDVCLGLTTHLTDITAGGTWSSSNTNITIAPTTGVATGNVVGTSQITYSLPTGCFVTEIATVNPLPAAITGTLNICAHLTTQLSDLSTGGTWSSGNVAIGTVGTATGVVGGVSPGTVTITYTLPTGCISTAIVTVNPVPDAITGVANICYEATNSLSDATPGGLWSSSNTAIASVGSTGLVYGAGVGYATISYTLAEGCTATDVVTVNALPHVFSITPTSGSYCEGGANGVVLGLNGSEVGVSYVLYYYASATGYDSSVTGYIAGTGDSLSFGHEYIAGTYTVLATNSITGCTAAMAGTAFITVVPTVNPVVSVVSLSGTTVCPGTLVTFVPDTLHAGASPSYRWYVNGVLVSVDPTYSYIPANGDVVSVTMHSDYTCVEPSTASATLTMTVLPDAVPGVTIAIFPGDTVCQYAAATFTATPTFGGPSPQYIWYVNGVQQAASGQEFAYYPSTGDVVYCKMISDYQCRSADTGYSNAAVMTVAPMIVPDVQVLATPGFIITAGQEDSLWTVVTNAGPNPAYQWAVNGVPVTGATSSYFVSQFNNYDSVSCVVTSDGYCDGISAFDWVYITVYPLSVQQVAASGGKVTLLPNPNSGSFTLRGNMGTVPNEEASIEITDMIGQVIYSNRVSLNGGNINEQIKLGSTLANGMYLLNLRSASSSEVIHFVIER